ncbi:MAG: ABC transporter ATP-binding protein/permease [Propionibacteriales bacterium]|nr:ABC transporter ATP-binding protein/permease [Propionibacteriales bacterium]
MTSSTTIIVMVCALGVVVVGGQLIFALQSQAADRLKQDMTPRVQTRLARSVAQLSPRSMASQETSVKVSVARAAVAEVLAQPDRALSVVAAALTGLALFVSLFRFNVWAGLLVLVSLVPPIVTFNRIAAMNIARWRAVATRDRLADYYTEQLVYQRTATELSTLGTGEQLVTLADGIRRDVRMIQLAYLKKVERAELLGNAVSAVLLCGALAVLFLNGSLAGAVGGLFGVVGAIGATRLAGYSVGQVLGSGAQVGAYLDFTAPSDTPDDVMPVHSGTASVHTRDLTVRYPNTTKPALDGVSITAQPGELVALVGANGAGKTTCVNAILGLVQTEGGEVIIGGERADAMSDRRRLGYFGLLSQEFGRYELTVGEAIRLGAPGDGGERVADLWSALTAARLADLVRAMPNQLDQQLGQQWGGIGLSGGEWQRLALARIYYRNAPIWILDEPTSAIDAETEASIFRELREHKTGHAVIVVSHRASTLQSADRIHVFDAGHVVQQGTFDELITVDGRFRELFDEQLITANPLGAREPATPASSGHIPATNS